MQTTDQIMQTTVRIMQTTVQIMQTTVQIMQTTVQIMQTTDQIMQTTDQSLQTIGRRVPPKPPTQVQTGRNEASAPGSLTKAKGPARRPPQSQMRRPPLR
jgi:hypothetical protein